jgi:sugar phosphate isomerase/epimerase
MVCILFVAGCQVQQQVDSSEKDGPEIYPGWKQSVQAYSFNQFTFYESIDKAASVGLKYIEAYPWQKLSKRHPGVTTNYDMSPDIRAQVKKKLAAAGIKLINYGVVDLTNDENQCRKVFDFAKDMGIETIVSEPPFEALGMIDKLCQEYRIKVALHNHPKPSIYFDPETVLKACKGRSKWIGACADPGHWIRSGFDPVESLKKLEGRIITFHFKDMNEYGMKAHTVIWGTGIADVEGMLTELHRQGFTGVISNEYEYNWLNSVPDIKACLDYYETVAGKLKDSGFTDFVANDLSNCDYEPGTWKMIDGVLTSGSKNNKNIWTKDSYDDFILDLEFKIAKWTNSGVIYRATTTKGWDWVQEAIEVQIYDSYGKKVNNQACGSIFDALAPTENMMKPVGEWNHMNITVKGSLTKVVLNGTEIIYMDVDLWDTANKNPDGSKNKYNMPLKDFPRSGVIGLQDHGFPVWFKNIKIRKL